MLDIKELSKAVRQVAEEKGLEATSIMEVIESSIAAAYKKEYGERGVYAAGVYYALHHLLANQA